MEDYSQSMLSLDKANIILETAISHARSAGFKPIAVAVLDSGGYAKALVRDDGASNLRPKIASAKAWGSIAMGVGSRQIARLGNEQPPFLAALTSLSGGKIVPVAGGVLIRNELNELIGAVGISGDNSENDEACAVAGIEAAGFKADKG